MSIRVVCPNGHVLKVKDALAGKTGLCPLCKARVQVPQPQAAEISEDAILDILGPGVSNPSKDSGIFDAAEGAEATPDDEERRATPKKSCQKCHHEISAGIHICPYCNTYIAGLTDT